MINTHLVLGKNTTIYPNATFGVSGVIEIGENVDIGNGTIIYSSKEAEVTIGSNTSIAANCYIIDMNHGIERDKLIREQPNDEEKVTIGEDCWLGTGVKILKGVSIGKDAVIGAAAIVTRDIPEYAIAVGVPAKVIG